MPAPMPTHPTPERHNRLLELLPNDERKRMEASTQRIPIKPHDMLHPPGQAMRHVYFPLWGVVSLMTPLEDGSAVETATIGNEGMVGIHAFLGGGALGNSQA